MKKRYLWAGLFAWYGVVFIALATLEAGFLAVGWKSRERLEFWGTIFLLIAPIFLFDWWNNFWKAIGDCLKSFAESVEKTQKIHEE
jgi:hypothetical protein